MPEKKTSEKPQGQPENESRTGAAGRRFFPDHLTPPSSRTVFRIVVVAIIVWHLGGFVTGLISSLTNLFLMIILSIFFAYLIDPLVRFIRRPFKERHLEKLMPRSLAILIAYLIVFSVLGVAIAYLAPRIADQAREFAENLPGYSAVFQERVADLNNRYDRLNISDEFQQKISERLNFLLDSFASFITTTVFGLYLLSLVSYLPWLVLIPILSFFFLKDIHLFKDKFLGCFPSGRWRARAEAVLSDVNKTLAAYTRAQLISCLLIGFVCTIGFYLVGIKYALLLGILAGIGEFVPLIGPLVIAILVTSVAGFSGSSWQALATAVFLIALRLIHDYVTYPRIVREGMHLPPLLVILSVLAGEQLAGIPGVFLSIPIVALLIVGYRHILEHTGHEGLFAAWLEPKQADEETP